MVLKKVNIFWFRRDLRLEDNCGLSHALQEGNVIPVFIFDKIILNKLENKRDPRLSFIHTTINNLKEELKKFGSDLKVYYGNPDLVWPQIFKEFDVNAIFFNNDYEGYARKRDKEVCQLCESEGILVHTFKDQVIFEKEEIVKENGEPYIVFTPYSRRWKARWQKEGLVTSKSENHLNSLVKLEQTKLISLEEMGFSMSSMEIPSSEVDSKLISNYTRQRDFPALKGTSKLGIHLRFGTISIRKLVKYAATLDATYVNELIWRDFYQMILWNYPYVEKTEFREDYREIPWLNNEELFEKWCNGQTGFPLVDAGMRELNATGFMHNRVRMLVASFLTKHLLIDWRWGEAYFAEKLLDFELASNNGGWQWAAGCGTDAAPYFRIFNPELQLKKFDKNGSYVKKWVPEWLSEDYPKPVVDHKFARERALLVYKQALDKFRLSRQVGR